MRACFQFFKLLFIIYFITFDSFLSCFYFSLFLYIAPLISINGFFLQIFLTFNNDGYFFVSSCSAFFFFNSSTSLRPALPRCIACIFFAAFCFNSSFLRLSTFFTFCRYVEVACIFALLLFQLLQLFHFLLYLLYHVGLACIFFGALFALHIFHHHFLLKSCFFFTFSFLVAVVLFLLFPLLYLLP